MNILKIQTSDRFQPEKEYSFHVLFREMLGVDYCIEYQQIGGHLLQLPNGAELKLLDGFSDPSAQISCLLPDSSRDPFAALFYTLTRWEEKNQLSMDEHGRFPAAQSIAWQQGYLHRPVVNEWVDELWDSLVRLGWPGQRKRRKFQISFSCDVDHPRLWWSAADRVKTLAGAILKRQDLKECVYWLKNHFFQPKDPYDVFDEWFDLLAENNLIGQFNFMGARAHGSDCWYPLQHPFVSALMHKIADRGHRIGFHPSYEAFEDAALFEKELSSLREISPIGISAGRQHYLRFSTPETWKMWDNAGLTEDSTLGYAEAEGFRCGVCHDFPVFDTEKRKMLHLREKPLLAMDVTLAQYRGYSPQQALEHLSSLRKTVEKHGGDFTLLWHNSSWNTPFWEEWKSVLRTFISS